MFSFLASNPSLRGSRCSRYTVVVSLLLSLCWGELVCADQKIIIITSSDSRAYQLAVATLDSQLTESGLLSSYTLNYWTLDEAKARGQGRAALIKAQARVIVTVGSAAADYAAHHLFETPIICSFITRNAFDAISANSPSNKSITAVFMDQPIKRLIRLSALLRKDQSPYKIGMLSQSVLSDPNLAGDELELVNDIEISSAMLLLNKNPIKQIEPLMKNSDVFIVRPSTSLFNRLVAKLVLQLGMRYKTPVIGFSEKYAKAGALLSLYANPENIGVDASDMINEWLRSPQKIMPAPREGEQFSIVINQRIAQKQGMTLDAEQLQRELQRMEGE